MGRTESSMEGAGEEGSERIETEMGSEAGEGR